MNITVISEKYLDYAWTRALNELILRGKPYADLAREISNLGVIFSNGLKSKDVQEIFKEIVGEKWILAGKDPILSGEYYKRLTDYHSVNQLDYILNRLKRKRGSKQLYCTIFSPMIDIKPNLPYNPKMPCLVGIDIKAIRDTLEMFALFRSQDYIRKAFGNFLGLYELTRKIAGQVNLPRITVIVYARSAHIRRKEFNKAQKIVMELRKVRAFGTFS